jgi:single-strand DNA-binding protein
MEVLKMAGVNKIIIVGNLGRDVDLKYTKEGKTVCNFSVGVTERKGQDTEWFNIVAWEKLAEICAEYLKKGSQVYIDGRQKTDSWEHEGEKKYKQTVVANNMTMLGQAGGGGHATGSNQSSGNPSSAGSGGDEFEDSDIPFS